MNAIPVKEATRAIMVERVARALSLKRHGSEGFWTAHVSEASQAVSGNTLKRQNPLTRRGVND